MLSHKDHRERIKRKGILDSSHRLVNETLIFVLFEFFHEKVSQEV
jgi:hypothetical protein